MACKTWEDVYRTRTTEELYKTFKGWDNSTYDQKKLAQKILIERNFKFENADQQIKKWNENSKKKKKEFAKKHPILTFIDRNTGYGICLISGYLLIKLLSGGSLEEFKELPEDIKFVAIMIVSILLIFFMLGAVKQFKSNRKRRIIE